MPGLIPLTGSIFANKSARPGYQPLLICDITAFDSSFTLHLSTHRLNTVEGGFNYSSTPYLSRIADEDLDAISALSATGINLIGRATLHIADPDRFLWRNYQYNPAASTPPAGFKGCTVKCYMILWQVGSANFSSDRRLIFSGFASKPYWDNDTLTLTFSNSKNPQLTFIPLDPVQFRCGEIFPLNSDERGKAADTVDHKCFGCGYSPDISSGNARGNLDPSTSLPFTFCTYVIPACKERGMFDKDSANRPTRRNSGVQWSPPLASTVIPYGGSKVTVYSSPNDSKYGQRFPMIWGTQWVTGVVLTCIAGADSSRYEVAVCRGNVGSGYGGGIVKVILNDHEVPRNVGGNVVEVLYRYDEVTTGDRTGTFTSDAGFTDSSHNPLGDPHGNIKVIEIVVPNALANGSAIPNIRILVTGPGVRYYTSPTDSTIVQFDPLRNIYNDGGLCPPWFFFDLATRCNYESSELDIQSFLDHVSVCNDTITYTSITGADGARCRYSIAFSVDGKTTRDLASVLRATLQSCNASLDINPATGLYQFSIRRTLAAQQPTLPPGSNYAGSGISSLNMDGGAAVGFPAWVFDDSNILWEGDPSTGRASIRQLPDSDSDLATTVSCSFQDAENQFQLDSQTIIDVEALPRVSNQRLSSSSFAPEGINCYDQLHRVARTYFSEQNRGNPRNDAGGTLRLQVKGTSELMHLRVGMIVSLSCSRDSIVNQLFRINRVAYSKDGEIITADMAWHNDIWYTDPYTQSNSDTNTFSNPAQTQLQRTCFPWKAGYSPIYELGTTPLYALETGTFGVALDTTTLDNNSTVIPDIDIIGLPPVNDLSPYALPPLVPIFANVSSSGGSASMPIGPGVIVICALDDGTPQRQSAPSEIIHYLTTSANSTITIPAIFFQPNTGGYAVYMGSEQQTLLLQSYVSGGTPPSSITITTPPGSFTTTPRFGPPDNKFSRFIIQAKRTINGGIFALNTDGRVGTTLRLNFLSQSFAVNSLNGRQISLMAQASATSGVPLPIFTTRITSNTATSVTLFSIPTGFVISPGDTFLFRFHLDTVGDTTIGDSLIANTVYPGGFTDNILGMEVRVLAGTGRGQARIIGAYTPTTITPTKKFLIPLDSTSIISIMEPNWAYNQPTSLITSNATNSAALAKTNIVASLLVDQFKDQLLFIRVLSADQDGLNTGIESLAPFREIYISLPANIGSGSGTTGISSSYNF